MRIQLIGPAMIFCGVLGFAVALLAPAAFWDYVDPAPGGRVVLGLFASSCLLIVIGVWLHSFNLPRLL